MLEVVKLDRATRKLYYEYPYLCCNQARVVECGQDYIELDSTVAYPEGGGQEADCGTLHFESGTKLRFVGAKKLFGYSPILPDFPSVKVGGIIRHLIHKDDQPLLSSVGCNELVKVCIDVERRARLSLSHTASHLLYLGVKLCRLEAAESTIGCHIKVDGCRFDFRVQSRFTADDINFIQETANNLVARNYRISVIPHPEYLDARTWHCGDYSIPCGGTHIENTGAVGPVHVKRKSIGVGKERISCTFPQAVIDLSKYHS